MEHEERIIFREMHAISTLSEAQRSALLARGKSDAELQKRLKSAADLDAAVQIAKEAGFDVSKSDWLGYQAKQTLELSDDELEEVAVAGLTWISNTCDVGIYC